MNTIHSTFNSVNTSYTVIGSNIQNNSKSKESSFSVIILNNGGRPYRGELYKELLNLDISEIVSIEQASKSHFDLEKETIKNEKLRFLILQNEVSIGEMINIGISECSSDNVFVIWDDMNINTKTISYRVFEKIMEEKTICTVPLFSNSKDDIIPTLMTPLFHKELLKVVPLENNKQLKTLFPFMFVGIYNKDKFIQLGGYDIDIKNSYWQKLDFGLRANLWGEKIKAHKAFTVKLRSDNTEIEDITPDQDYRLYSLKNISVKLKNDVGYLPLIRFFSYFEKSGGSIIEAFRTFIIVRKWVYINRYRFKFTAPSLTSNWDDL
ncbi:MAG: hypothetical protein OCD02_08950 [Spirochaetaceae bacterium]